MLRSSLPSSKGRRFVSPLAKPAPAIPAKRPAPLDWPPDSDEHPLDTPPDSDEHFYNVLWRKMSTKKHKTWDGDGVVVVAGKTFTLKDSDGKEIGKTTSNAWGVLQPGETISISGKDIEVVSSLDPEQYKSGRVFIHAVENVKTAQAPRIVTAYKNPAKNIDAALAAIQHPAPTPKPRHNPNTPGALVMPRPSHKHSAANNPKGAPPPIVDVVVDPVLSGVLREHQRKGVTFLYECVMGMRDYNGQGAILADEMGLGKTLQTISLLWTLLKQSPYPPGSTAKRALIVCPATLVANWTKEFNKWLGRERIRVFAVDGKSNVNDFLVGRVYEVMIIGYEKMRLIADILKPANFDVVICDEGHRLKDPKIKTSQVLNDLRTRRRIILSGTPIQNNLEELFAMIDFCNPGILGSYATFKQVFEKPILAGRARGASAAEKRLAEDRAGELSRVTGLFVLRRTADVNSKYLPPKTTFVLFAKPTALQADLYDQVLNSNLLKRSLEGSNETGHLRAISVLKKIVNCPTLLASTAENENENDEDEATGGSDGFFGDVKGALAVLHGHEPYSRDWIAVCSGKLALLDSLVSNLFEGTDEKIVIVSMSTQSLDILEQLCRTRSWPLVRLDGSTATTKRQPIIDRFNGKDHPERILLLSSKSGGAGLNVVGASRMILFDLSWNPADDAQAMARIWREGQKRNVFIYRFVATGTLEENQLQRQAEKSSLSSAMMDNAQSKSSKQQKFTQEELRRIFRFNQRTLSATHDALRCRCDVPHDSEDEEEDGSGMDDEEAEGQAKSKGKGKALLTATAKDGEQKSSDLKEEYRHLLLRDASATEEVKQVVEESFGDLVLGATLSTTNPHQQHITAVFANTRNS